MSTDQVNLPLFETHCRYHPGRTGVGVCMVCRSVICIQCSTRIDGINHCAACVGNMANHALTPEVVGRVWRQWVLLVCAVAAVGVGTYLFLRVLYVWG